MNKKHWTVLSLLALVLVTLLACASTSLAEETTDDMDEWTVLFYMCGSDLESKYGYASSYLLDIANTNYPDSWMPSMAQQYGLDPQTLQITRPGKVNVLIETGGSKVWYTRDEGMYLNQMPVDPGALQRWSFVPHGAQSALDEGTSAETSDYEGYRLLESLPARNMADPETLADFIRWGKQTCPAKKYALVLWDHGGGALSGLFVDELFDNDIMYLYELRQALKEGGVVFDALIIDACLMANIETAWNVRESARWLVASEEEVPSRGTAVTDWLQALYAYPECEGEWLGRCVCDMTGIMYANGPDEMAKSLLTWSVIDLTRIDRLVEACGAYIRIMGDALARYPSETVSYIDYIHDAETYGGGQHSMYDIGSVIYNPGTMQDVSLRVRGELMDALADAVAYVVRGPGRNAARGLSFCFPINCDARDLDIYAQNCPMPLYLAYIDAVTSWKAPDWVYEQTEPIPGIESIEEFRFVSTKALSPQGLPSITFGETGKNVRDVYYRLYRLDEKTGQTVSLGRTICLFEMDEAGDLFWRAGDPMHWPAINGELCCIEMIQESDYMRLYSIPVQIDSKERMLRCGRTMEYSYSEEDNSETRYSDYEVYGVWENYDVNSRMMNRSVQPLAMFSGQAYRLLYPVDGDSTKKLYAFSDEMTMYRALEVQEILLPPGTYYIEYEVRDPFMRFELIDRLEFQWDGENLTYPHLDEWLEAS